MTFSLYTKKKHYFQVILKPFLVKAVKRMQSIWHKINSSQVQFRASWAALHVSKGFLHLHSSQLISQMVWWDYRDTDHLVKRTRVCVDVIISPAVTRYLVEARSRPISFKQVYLFSNVNWVSKLIIHRCL